MLCPKCNAENPAPDQFCRSCGSRLQALDCAACGRECLPGDKFCGGCGARLEAQGQGGGREPAFRGERKQVTVLFSDLSEYAAITEQMDPEEVRDIMSRVFSGTAEIISRYEGHIDKFIGDAVMAVFGVPWTHEDDPVRAIRAAFEIRELVRRISAELEPRVGKPLSMHSGIDTGMVVTGTIDLEQGTEQVIGDTVNLASRITDLAEGNEILVGPGTHERAEGYFLFQALEPTRVKGRKEQVQIYRVVAPKTAPAAVHRLSGLRAELVGREGEMRALLEAARELTAGRGGIVTISGEAGTGKSRLVEEFRAELGGDRVQWKAGRCYAYARGIPFFPLMDLLNQVWQVDEGEGRERVREKIESGAGALLGPGNDVCGCIGRLYSLEDPAADSLDPESWRQALTAAAGKVLSALARARPTVIVLEDLHWADRSSLELLRAVLPQCAASALVLCLYRPPFRLFPDGAGPAGNGGREIALGDLSPAESMEMLWSLLQTRELPPELRGFIQEKAGGNPFYLEEMVNALIESGTLVRTGAWTLARALSQPDIPLTVGGLISARIDRLDADLKRVLQEASVIGRSFSREILERTTARRDLLDECLAGLERLDLIRVTSRHPDLEYVFKHVLTQDVVYDGLLRKERQQIHERIGTVIEGLFPQRRVEICETLALHFKEGRTFPRALDYLALSGEKSLKRFAVEESHQYYRDAYDLLADQQLDPREKGRRLTELLNAWAPVYYYRGAFGELEVLLDKHLETAETLEGTESLGMYYVWLGMARWGMERFGEAYRYASRALGIGEGIGSKRVVGYACAWLPWICVQIGRLDEAPPYAERAREMSSFFESDHYPYYESFDSKGYVSWARGESGKARAFGAQLLEYGRGHSSIRGTTWGHIVLGWGYMADGDFPAAIDCYRKALQVSADPFYSQFPKLFLASCHLSNREPLAARRPLEEILEFTRGTGCKVLATPARVLTGAVMVSQGRLRQGLAMIEECRAWSEANQGSLLAVFAEMVLGEIYLQMILRETKMRPGAVLRNALFLARNLPVAGRKAERHLLRARETARGIGAKGFHGQACLRLGDLSARRGRSEAARRFYLEADGLFKECEAEIFSRQVRAALAALAEKS